MLPRAALRNTAPLRALFSLLLSLSACVISERRPAGPPPAADEDLLNLLPAGAEAILDLDLQGARGAPLGPRLWAQLPAGARAAAALFTPNPLADLDALVMAVSGLGTERLEAVVVVRGRLDAPSLRARFLETERGAALSHYHGQEVLEPPPPVVAGGRALAWLSARAAVLGGRASVRQVIDNLHGDGAGARSQAEMMAALQRAPHAQKGRPALWFALLPSRALRDGLRAADLAELGADAGFVSGALALGDGMDLGLVGGYAELAVAKDVARRLSERAEALRKRPVMLRSGISRHLRSLVVLAAAAGGPRKVPEVHVAFRLAEADAEDLTERLAMLRSLLDPAPR